MFSNQASIVLLSAAVVLSGGCSLVVQEPESCSQDSDCIGAFGFGSACQSDGYCSAAVEVPERCSRTFPEDLFERPGDYADRILLGSLFSYTDHNDTLQAADLAVRQVNGPERRELEGRRFAIVHCDYTADAGNGDADDAPDDGLDDVQAVELVAPFLARELGVPAIIGPRGSSRTEVTFNAVRDFDTVVISPSATSPALTALDGGMGSNENPGLLWRTAPPDSLQSQVIASTLLEDQVGGVAVIYQQGTYGDALSSLFSDNFSAGGGAEPQLLPYESGQELTDAVIEVAARIEAGEVDEVLVISSEQEDYVAFLSAASIDDFLPIFLDTLGDENRGLFFTDAAFSANIYVESAARSSGLFPKIRGTRPAPAEGSIFQNFSIEYLSEYDEDSTGSAFTPHSFDAAWIVMYAVAWATFNEDEVTGTTVARGLRRLSSGQEVDIVPNSWGAVLGQFELGSSVNVQGASGSLDFDSVTEETNAPIELWALEADANEESGYAFIRLGVTEPS